MRVGLVLEDFDSRCGGLEQWTWQFAAALLRRGHEVHVVAKRFADKSHRMPVIAHCLANARSRLGFAEAAQVELRSLNLDIVHDMGSGWHCDVFQPHGGSWLSVTERKLEMRAPWMRFLKPRIDHLLPRHHQFQSLLQRQYADNGQIFVALSRTVAEDLVHFHNVQPSRIRIVYNGVDTDRFSPDHRCEYRETIREHLGVSEASVVLLIVAHNFKLKGVPALLQAMKLLAAEHQPVHLVVVGGKRLHRWRSLAGQRGIGSYVTFTGIVEDTFPYYAAADVYVHPTFYDPCSLVLLEAAASGLPIVTTKECNGVSELLSDGVDSLLVDSPADTDGLAQRIRVLCEGPVRHEMGKAARQMALGHTFDRNVEEMLGVYADLAQYRHAA